MVVVGLLPAMNVILMQIVVPERNVLPIRYLSVGVNVYIRVFKTLIALIINVAMVIFQVKKDANKYTTVWLMKNDQHCWSFCLSFDSNLSPTLLPI